MNADPDAGAGSGSATPVGDIRLGISSWGSLPGFYPTSVKSNEKLPWYARFFSVVEVNVSHYRIVPPRTYVNWAESTPPTLIFDIKAFRELTHEREPPPAETFAAFRESYAPLRELGRFGCVLFQFPPRFANTPASRAYLRRVAREMAGDVTAVEFRNYTWLSPESAPATFSLLEESGLAYAIADEPQIPHDTVPPLPAITNEALAYIRLHGRNATSWYRGQGGSRYDYDYSASELDEWATIARDLSSKARQVHILFNNNARGDGTRNALTLAEMLGVSLEHSPELPPEQPRLFKEGE
jgi:uncharacterized protein YecE (DUF72 family)